MVENEKILVDEIYNFLEGISNDPRFNISKFFEIDRATKQALDELSMSW